MQSRKKAELKRKGKLCWRPQVGGGNCHFRGISVAPSGIQQHHPVEISPGDWFSKDIGLHDTNVLTYLVAVVVLVSTQSKLSGPNVLGLPQGLRTLNSDCSQFGNVVQISHICTVAIKYLQFFSYTECKKKAGITKCIVSTAYIPAYNPKPRQFHPSILSNNLSIISFDHEINQSQDPWSELCIYLVDASHG